MRDQPVYLMSASSIEFIRCAQNFSFLFVRLDRNACPPVPNSMVKTHYLDLGDSARTNSLQ